MSGAGLVVVGGGLAALRALEAARRTGYDGRLTLLAAEDRAPYDRPPLSKARLAPGTSLEVEPLRSAQSLRDDLGVDVRLGRAATGLDTEAHEVHLDEEVVAYESLVIATGASPRPFPGDHLDGVHHLRTVEDSSVVRRGLDAGARLVVVGAGFIGSEVASAARAHGLEVSVVDAESAPMTRSLGAEVGALVAGLHRAAGVDLRLGVGVAGLEEVGGRVGGVRLDDAAVLPADLVVLGVGVAPATGWLEDSGLLLHPRDRGIVCDRTLATSAAGVWAAGDVAHAPNALFDDDLQRAEHWTNAAEQGAAAARHGLDPGAASAWAPVPYFWSEMLGHRLQFVGTPLADEVVVVAPRGAGGEDPADVAGTMALYRRGDRLVGTLAVDGSRVVMKFRRRIANRGDFAEAVAAARELVAARGAATPG